MKTLFTTLIISFITFSSYAQQIKLTENDFPDTSQAVTFYYIFGLSSQVKAELDIGVGDADELYDFNKLKDIQVNTSQTLSYLLPSETPFAAEHPTANLAYMSTAIQVGSDTTFIRWKYMKVDTEKAVIIGSSFEIDTASYFNGNAPAGRNVFTHTTYDNPEVLMDTSFQRGYLRNDTSTMSFTLDNLKHYETVIRNYWVDGYGELDHPTIENSNLDVLRAKLRMEIYNRDTVNGVEDYSIRDTAYFLVYITKTFGTCVTVSTNSTYTDIQHISFLALAEILPSAKPLTAINFNLYPNPASSQVTIEFGKVLTDNYTLKLYNNLGQLSGSQALSKGTISSKIDISTLARGTYYMSLEGANGEKLLTKKLIVQ